MTRISPAELDARQRGRAAILPRGRHGYTVPRVARVSPGCRARQRVWPRTLAKIRAHGRGWVKTGHFAGFADTEFERSVSLRLSSQENPVKKSGEKTETFSASALAVGTPKACYPSSTQPGPEGVPSQIRAVDRPDSWSLGRLHPPLDGSPTQYICLSFWIFWFVWVRVLQETSSPLRTLSCS